MLPTCHYPGLSVGLSSIWNSKNYHLQYRSSFCYLCFSMSCAPLCSLLPLLTSVCTSHCCCRCLCSSISYALLHLCLPEQLCVPHIFLLSLFSSSPCLSHPPRPMFPSGDPLLIHHYFHGYLAGFTVRPGSLESREVIECLYACREGLDYSDFDSLGKGMKVRPSAQLAWVSSTLLPSLASLDFACSATSDSSLSFSFVSLLA